jgi:hypothetical protein
VVDQGGERQSARRGYTDYNHSQGAAVPLSERIDIDMLVGLNQSIYATLLQPFVTNRPLPIIDEYQRFME